MGRTPISNRTPGRHAGRDVEAQFPPKPARARPAPFLDVRNLAWEDRLNGVTLTVAKRLDNAGMAVPSSASGTGLSLVDAKKLDRMPAPGRARDIAGSCL